MRAYTSILSLHDMTIIKYKSECQCKLKAWLWIVCPPKWSIINNRLYSRDVLSYFLFQPARLRSTFLDQKTQSGLSLPRIKHFPLMTKHFRAHNRPPTSLLF